MARYRIMYWKHIPQSFTVEGDGRTVKKQLSEKIQNKIDAYAMAENATSTADYAAQYKRGEWDTYNTIVTEWEREQYLRLW